MAAAAVLHMDSSNFSALNELANLALATGHRSAARTAYRPPWGRPARPGFAPYVPVEGAPPVFRGVGGKASGAQQGTDQPICPRHVTINGAQRLGWLASAAVTDPTAVRAGA
jgi:hypothetical protein